MKNVPGWNGKFCIVTGAASGIGNATLQLLVNMGAIVLGIDRKDPNEFKINAPRGEQVHYRKCDLSNPEQIWEVFQEFKEYKLEALFNVAALPSNGLGISDLSVGQWDEVINVNLRAVFLTSKFSLPLFKNNGGGCIVNVSSVHAFASMKNHAAYAASKGGVNSLTGQLALELNPLNIRVVGVAPGSVRTPMTTNDIERDKSLLEELGFPTDGRSIGHVGEPEEIAEVLLWSASSAASFVNGTVITADAGLLARLTFE
jgi:NAD(P)-dependent dehydrogenase (short-subunit alcohol dehydrogenase family)